MPVRSAASLAAACLVALAAVAGTAPQVAAADGYTETAATVYTLDPVRGVIDVAVDVTIANHKPDVVQSNPCLQWAYDPWLGSYPYSTTCQSTLRSYLYSTSVWVEAEATRIRATTGSTQLKVSVGKPNPYFREVTIAFPNLYSGQTRRIHVGYTIPGGRPRAENPTRAMQAYANFCLIAHGYDSGTVSVHLPAGFAVTTTGSTLTAVTSGSDQVFSSGSVSDPSSWWACIEGTNDAGYAISEVTAPGGQTVMLESWPEDAAWTAAIDEDLHADVPSLGSLTGQAMDGSMPLVIRETVTGDEYAG
ncbi:MAG: hypothetical protein ACM3JP_01710, partial [Betaproteobacteria bacterium]